MKNKLFLSILLLSTSVGSIQANPGDIIGENFFTQWKINENQSSNQANLNSLLIFNDKPQQSQEKTISYDIFSLLNSIQTQSSPNIFQDFFMPIRSESTPAVTFDANIFDFIPVNNSKEISKPQSSLDIFQDFFMPIRSESTPAVTFDANIFDFMPVNNPKEISKPQSFSDIFQDFFPSVKSESTPAVSFDANIFDFIPVNNSKEISKPQSSLNIFQDFFPSIKSESTPAVTFDANIFDFVPVDNSKKFSNLSSSSSNDIFNEIFSLNNHTIVNNTAPNNYPIILDDIDSTINSNEQHIVEDPVVHIEELAEIIAPVVAIEEVHPAAHIEEPEADLEVRDEVVELPVIEEAPRLVAPEEYVEALEIPAELAIDPAVRVEEIEEVAPVVAIEEVHPAAYIEEAPELEAPVAAEEYVEAVEMLDELAADPRRDVEEDLPVVRAEEADPVAHIEELEADLEVRDEVVELPVIEEAIRPVAPEEYIEAVADELAVDLVVDDEDIEEFVPAVAVEEAAPAPVRDGEVEAAADIPAPMIRGEAPRAAPGPMVLKGRVRAAPVAAEVPVKLADGLRVEEIGEVVPLIGEADPLARIEEPRDGEAEAAPIEVPAVVADVPAPMVRGVAPRPAPGVMVPKVHVRAVPVAIEVPVVVEEPKVVKVVVDSAVPVDVPGAMKKGTPPPPPSAPMKKPEAATDGSLASEDGKKPKKVRSDLPDHGKLSTGILAGAAKLKPVADRKLKDSPKVDGAPKDMVEALSKAGEAESMLEKARKKREEEEAKALSGSSLYSSGWGDSEIMIDLPILPIIFPVAKTKLESKSVFPEAKEVPIEETVPVETFTEVKPDTSFAPKTISIEVPKSTVTKEIISTIEVTVKPPKPIITIVPGKAPPSPGPMPIPMGKKGAAPMVKMSLMSTIPFDINDVVTVALTPVKDRVFSKSVKQIPKVKTLEEIMAEGTKSLAAANASGLDSSDIWSSFTSSELGVSGLDTTKKLDDTASKSPTVEGSLFDFGVKTEADPVSGKSSSSSSEDGSGSNEEDPIVWTSTVPEKSLDPRVAKVLGLGSSSSSSSEDDGEKKTTSTNPFGGMSITKDKSDFVSPVTPSMWTTDVSFFGMGNNHGSDGDKDDSKVKVPTKASSDRGKPDPSTFEEPSFGSKLLGFLGFGNNKRFGEDHSEDKAPRKASHRRDRVEIDTRPIPIKTSTNITRDIDNIDRE